MTAPYLRLRDARTTTERKTTDDLAAPRAATSSRVEELISFGELHEVQDSGVRLVRSPPTRPTIVASRTSASSVRSVVPRATRSVRRASDCLDPADAPSRSSRPPTSTSATSSASWEEIDRGQRRSTPINLKLDFEQWDRCRGLRQVRACSTDSLERRVRPGDVQRTSATQQRPSRGDWEQTTGAPSFPFGEPPDHGVGLFDVDYDGRAETSPPGTPWSDLPLIFEELKLIGGFALRVDRARHRQRSRGRQRRCGSPRARVATRPALNPGDADVRLRPGRLSCRRSRIVYRARFKEVTLRASYTETVARQTFKELSPILQQEFLGGPIFIGNPEAPDELAARTTTCAPTGGLTRAASFSASRTSRKDIDEPDRVRPAAGRQLSTTPPRSTTPTARSAASSSRTRQALGHFLGGASKGCRSAPTRRSSIREVQLPSERGSRGVQSSPTSTSPLDLPRHDQRAGVPLQPVT